MTNVDHTNKEYSVTIFIYFWKALPLITILSEF